MIVIGGQVVVKFKKDDSLSQHNHELGKVNY